MGIASVANNFFGFGGDDGGGFRVHFALAKYTHVRLASDRVFGWSSTNLATGTTDIGMSRNASGVIEINSGTAGTFRDLKLRSLISSGGTITLSNYTVATLPTAASNTHAIVAVTDGNASPTYRGAVTGGGSTKGLVYCDGSSWMWH